MPPKLFSTDYIIRKEIKIELGTYRFIKPYKLSVVSFENKIVQNKVLKWYKFCSNINIEELSELIKRNVMRYWNSLPVS